MKRLISFLAVICMLLGTCSVSLAADRPYIKKQPVSQTVKAGESLTFSLEAENTSGSGITWYFQNPLTGESFTGKKLSSVVPGLKVKNPNSRSITLKNVPESMHGWTAYCHLGPKSGGVNSDTVMILIAGLPVPEMPSPTPGISTESSVDNEVSEAVPTPTPVPEPIVITGNAKIELYKVDSKGTPLGTAQQELVFDPGTSASFLVKMPDDAEGSVQYVKVGSVRLTPDAETRGMTIQGWPASASVKIKVLKPGSEAEATEEALILPEESVAPVDPSSLVNVTCENCRFTGYTYSFAESGQVPVGSTITIIASGGIVGKGYFINGAKKASHKNEASFQIQIDGDTVITMNPQK